MTEHSINLKALVVTLSICIIVDAIVFIFAVWLAESFGKGLLIFLVGGDPPTILVSHSMYVWFKERIPSHAKL